MTGEEFTNYEVLWAHIGIIVLILMCGVAEWISK